MAAPLAPLRTAPSLLALVALPLVLGACTDDADPAPAADGATDAEAAVRAFYDDFAGGDLRAACARWTPAYADLAVRRWNHDGFGKRVDGCPGLLRSLTGIYAMVGDPAEQLAVTDTSGELTSDTTARVDVTIASSQGDAETYELTLVDGDWLISGDDPGSDMLESSSPASP